MDSAPIDTIETNQAHCLSVLSQLPAGAIETAPLPEIVAVAFAFLATDTRSRSVLCLARFVCSAGSLAVLWGGGWPPGFLRILGGGSVF
jgi:hypothetical protein